MIWGNGMDKIYRRLLLKAGIIAVVVLTSMLILLPSAMATPGLFAQIPEGFEQSCNLCHSQPPSLNSFGESFKGNGYSFDGMQTEPEPNHGTNPGTTPEEPTTTTPDSQGITVELLLPAEITRGDKVNLQAKVTSGSQAVEGKKVEFYEETNFFISGKMKLGQATTDASGIASINYWPRATEEDVKLIAAVPGEGGSKRVEGVGTISPALTGTLIEHAEGLRVPFVGNWMIAVLVSGVWLTYAFVVVTTLQIRKARDVAEVEEVPGEEEKQQYA
ncbi:MAG: hypothetical protein ACYC2T_01850 [Bacillota bacterium]